MRGTVARIVADRGFGFIEGDDGQEYFFYAGALKGTDWEELAPGVPVEFERRGLEEGDKPDDEPRAVNVHLAENAIPAVDNETLPQGKVNP
jgi:cold shock CspA family protein